tara:strand:+ start:2335 stop:3999 length:1665 start_codon:yes stop_codon:yes gene_type:complete
MSQSNKGVIAVVAGGCLLGLALGLGYVFYWAPKQRAELTRSEIAEWGQHWSRARACLIGKAPASSDVLEAVVARELSDVAVKGKLAGCVGALKKLGRKDGANTEEQAVEDAWYALRTPLGKLAQAHAWRTAKEPNKKQQALWQNLATAIEEVDSGYLALLAAAKVSAPKTADTRLATATKIMSLPTPGNTPVSLSEVLLKEDRITYLASGQEGTYFAVVDQANAATFTQLSPLALRAADATWGLWVEHDGIPINENEAIAGDFIMAGPLDALGEPAADGTLLHTLVDGESVGLKFAIGDASRVALFRSSIATSESITWSYQLRGSQDAGVTWSSMPLPADELYVSLKREPTGNYLSWQDSPTSTVLHYQELSKDSSVVRTLEFRGDRDSIRNWPPEICHAPNRTWWLVDGHVYTLDESDALLAIRGRLEQDTNNYEQTMRCTDSGFAITSRSFGSKYRDRLAVQTCSLSECTEAPLWMLAPGDAKFFPLFHNGTYTVVVVIAGFAAIWDEGSTTPSVVVLGSDAPITGAVSRNGALEALMWPAEDNTPSLLKLR